MRHSNFYVLLFLYDCLYTLGVDTKLPLLKMPHLTIIGKTNRDEIQNQMRLKFARKLQKRNVTEKSHTSYSQKWLSNVN